MIVLTHEHPQSPPSEAKTPRLSHFMGFSYHFMGFHPT